MKTSKKVVLCVLSLLFSALVAIPVVNAEDAADADVKKSWDSAQVYLPGRTFSTVPSKVSVSKPLPVVIYLHGCTGITSHDSSWGGFLGELGYITILPDSMARRSQFNCDPKTRKGGLFPQAHALRQEEIRYALEQVKKTPWADPNNVFLMGHSEGGVAAARARIDGFSGVIISGWGCTNRKNPGFDGIFAPPTTAVLSLEFSKDDWANDVTRGSCADKFGERKNARRVVFPGNGHNDFDQSAAREAVAAFIKENLKNR